MTISNNQSPQMVLIPSDVKKDGFGILVRSNSMQNIGLPQPEKPIKKSRSVQFLAELKEENMNCAEPSYAICDDVKNSLWWSSEELKGKSMERRELIKRMFDEDSSNNTTGNRGINTSSIDDIDKKIMDLFKHCSSMNVSQVMRSRATKELLSLAAAEGDDSIRGLEVKMSKVIARQRKLHAHAVLSAAGKLLDDGNLDCTAVFTHDDILSAKSAQSSRASQVFARVLAQIDARNGARS